MTADASENRPENGELQDTGPMTSERLATIQDVLLQALEVPDDERGSFLAEACGGDAALRYEVESLLVAHSRSGPVDRLVDTLGARVLTELVEGAGLEGETIGRYRIMERLGRGGMSVVYRAWDWGLEREVALKFLPALLGSDQTLRERFLVEAQIAAGIVHPNICTIHEIGETEDGRLFIAMPLYDGETVRARIESGPLSEEEMLRLALQAAKGLATAHASGVVHRDVKPDNLMIARDGTLKILDFGIAMLEGAANPAGQTPGTACYMSPEQLKGDPVDARTDLWSLGVVLYEMLAGHRPIGGATPEAVRRSIMEEEIVPLDRVCPDISPGTAALVRALLERDPSRRLASAVELQQQLRRRLRQLDPPHVLQRPSRRLILGVPIVVALLMSVAIGHWRDRPSTPESVRSRPRRGSIAVLPFNDFTGDAGSRQLATGLHAVLVAQLQAVPGLTPVSISSLREYESDPVSIAGIARDLDVGSVLVGSLHRDGDRVLFTARLLDGTEGEQLWAERYQRELTSEGLFTIQADIGERIARALSLDRPPGQTLSAAVPPTQNRDAYEFYVRGKALLTDPLSAPGASADAEWMFRQAVRLDSTFALAWAALAEWHSAAATGVNAASWAVHRIPTLPGAGRMTADVALGKAVTWGPDLPETLKARGWYAFNVERDREGALAFFEEALQARPTDPDVVAAIGQIQISQHRWEEGLTNLERALRLDKGSFWRAVVLGLMYTRARRYDDAEQVFDDALSVAPTFAEGHIGKAIARLLRDGDVDGATQVLEAAGNAADRGELILRFAQPGARYPFIRILDDYFLTALSDSAVASHVRSRCLGCYLHLRAQLAEWAGNVETARIYYDSAFRTVVPGGEPDRRSYGYAARFAAGLGRYREAARYADSAVVNSPTLVSEALSGYSNLSGRAEVYVRLGRFEEAVAALEQLLSHPGLLSTKVLELDPLWNPLRERRDFQKLLATDR